MALDAVRMELYYEKQKSENDGPEVNDRNLSPGLFDALFKG
nr:hypothetical protein [Agrobacterium tumefaciens]